MNSANSAPTTARNTPSPIFAVGTAETPPGHGNFGKELPLVYRWAYDYNVPGAKEDFIPQNQPGPAHAH